MILDFVSWMPVLLYSSAWGCLAIDQRRLALIFSSMGCGAQIVLLIILANRLEPLWPMVLVMAVMLALLALWQNRMAVLMAQPVAILALIVLLTVQIAPTPPVDQGFLLLLHIIFVLIGYVVFALSCLLSIAYLYKSGQLKSSRLLTPNLPPLGVLETWSTNLIVPGFVCMTVGIMLGVFLPQTLPEQLLSFRQVAAMVVWLCYFILLFRRALFGVHGRHNAQLAIIGFVAVNAILIYELIDWSWR